MFFKGRGFPCIFGPSVSSSSFLTELDDDGAVILNTRFFTLDLYDLRTNHDY